MNQGKVVDKRPVIIVAEDDKAIIDVITIILQEEGYRTISVQQYDQLRKMLVQEPASLLLLDLWLTGENGSEICLALKQDPKTRDMPIIILSAHQQVEAIAKSAGADDVLQKPFDIDELIAKVKQHIHRKK